MFPPAVSWLPTTLAWKLLGLLLFLAVVVIVLKAAKNWQRNEYRRNASRRIAQMRSNVRSTESGHCQQLSELPALMKTTALHAYPREVIASLGGRSWLDFLAGSSGSHVFTQSAADALTKLAYQPRPEETLSQADAENLLDECERWIHQHRLPNGATAGD